MTALRRRDNPARTGAVFAAVAIWFAAVAPSAHAAFSNTADAGIPTVDGTVSAIALSPTRVYIGGNFSSVGGVARTNLAAIDRSTGAVDPNFHPSTDRSGVRALVVSGSSLYVGGIFTTFNGVPDNLGIVKIDASTGALDTTFHPGADAFVYALAPSPTGVYVGGSFQSFGAQTRMHLAELDGTTGAPTAFNPNANSDVYALAASGAGVYAAGQFTTIGGLSRPYLAKLNPTTGAADPLFVPIPDRPVRAVLVSNANLYVGGDFTTIGNAAHGGLAELDAATGTAVSTFNPAATSGSPQALTLTGNSLIAAGSFTQIGSASRGGIAELDSTTGALSPFNPTGSSVFALAVDRLGRFYAGSGCGCAQLGGLATSFARFSDASTTVVGWRGGHARLLGNRRGVRVSWRAGSDTDVASYAVLRVRHGRRVRISTVNGGAATSRSPGRAYHVTDRHGRRRDRYRIVALGLDGGHTVHAIPAARDRRPIAG